MSAPVLRALLFDVQGTLVDFHRPVLRMGAAINERFGLTLDWGALAARWRALYRDGMDAVIAGRTPWRRVDRIYRDALDALLDETGVGAVLDRAMRDAMNDVWVQLDPWPDSVAGLARLRQRYTLATLSNAGMAAVIAVVKRAGLPMDAVMTAELARAFKPDPAVYGMAATLLDLPPSALMMVACHKYDLHAARACGFGTAFVARPLEFGPDATADVTLDPAFTINARDLHDLADQLGA